MKIDIEERSRFLHVSFGRKSMTVPATTETGGPTGEEGRHRESKTWNFEGPNGKKYRVQIQVTDTWHPSRGEDVHDV